MAFSKGEEWHLESHMCQLCPNEFWSIVNGQLSLPKRNQVAFEYWTDSGIADKLGYGGIKQVFSVIQRGSSAGFRESSCSFHIWFKYIGRFLIKQGVTLLLWITGILWHILSHKHSCQINIPCSHVNRILLARSPQWSSAKRHMWLFPKAWGGGRGSTDRIQMDLALYKGYGSCKFTVWL